MAREYYDQSRHPTCANFREASSLLLRKWFRAIKPENRVFCDIGCGKSLLAETLASRLRKMDRVFLIDDSASMLAYSEDWAELGAHLVVGDASEIPLGAASVDVLVSSLGDPYNLAGFWAEVQRVLRPRGRMFFTTPSDEWAKSFRTAQQHDPSTAEFVLSDGRVVNVPSYVLPVSDQFDLIRSQGLSVRRMGEVPVSSLTKAPISPKLMFRRGAEASVVTGYVVTHADETPPALMLGLVGHTGPGKTSVATFLAGRGFVRVSLSDLLLEEATHRNLVASRAYLHQLGNKLRYELGGSVLVDRALVRYFSAPKHSKLVIDGLTNPAEVEAIRKSGGIVLSLVGPRHGRSRDEATESRLGRESGQLEPPWGQRVSESISLADAVIENTGSLDSLHTAIGKILGGFKLVERQHRLGVSTPVTPT